MINEYVVSQGAAITQAVVKNTRYLKRLNAAPNQPKLRASVCGAFVVATGILRSPGTVESTKPGAFGETLIAENLAVTLSEPFVDMEYNYATPKGGYKFLIFTVNTQYLGDGKKDYSAGRFEVRDLDTDATHKETPLYFEQPLDSGELSNGSYVWGNVGLEVQETSTILLVQYQLESFGDVFMYWNLTR